MADFEQIEIPDLDKLSQDTSIGGSGATYTTYDSKGSQANEPSSSYPASSNDDNDKPTAEYALHILFTRFVRYTERKLAILQTQSEDNIEALLGEGADIELDLILESLGHVARRRPKPVIDSIMYWRKTKREQPNVSLASLYVLCRALMEVIRQTPHDVLGVKLSEKLKEIVFKQLISAEPEVVASSGIRGANWRYLARLLGEMSCYRLASVDDRFLTELEKKITSKADEARVAVLLEAMQYLKIKLYPEEFLEESSTFLESISKLYTKTSLGSPLRNKYAKAISHILEPLAEAITVEVNQPMWAATMESLFKASLQEKQANIALSSRSTSITSLSSSSTLSSPSFSLSVMSLCLSPQPMFTEHWLGLLEANLQKLKAKPLKAVHLLPAAARLAWVYMFRCTESLNLTTKRIETLKRLFLSNNSRKYWQAIDADDEARDGCRSLIRSCFQGYQQYTLDELLFPMLVGADATSIAQQHAIAYDSAVLPERAGIAVDAFVETMTDLKLGNRPPFPSNRVETSLSSVQDGLSGAKQSKEQPELPHQPSISSALQGSIDLFGSCLGQISQWLEQGGATLETSSRQNSVSHLVAFASGVNSNQNQHSESRRYEPGIRTAEQHLLLVFIKSWPSWWSSEQHLRHLDVLCRCLGHPIGAISATASCSIRNLATTCDLKTLFTPFTKALMLADTRFAELSDLRGPLNGSGFTKSFEPSGAFHAPSSSFSLVSSLGHGNSGSSLHTSSSSQDIDAAYDSPQGSKQSPKSDASISNYLRMYVEMIEIWINRLQNGDSAVFGPSIDSQLLNIWAAIEEIEGNGLYFLCSQDMHTRSLGLRVLWLTTEMDQAVINFKESNQPELSESKPSRVITLLQNTPIYQIISAGNSRIPLSMPERNRLAKFRSKRASLARLAESTSGVDNALWLKLFPFVISLCFETHPIPVALCRNVVSDRLIQMHDNISEKSLGPSGPTMSYAEVALIEQWKIYLIVACSTLTSTEEQKLHVPVSASSSGSNSSLSTMHSRKRSHQKITLHHQRITSARSVFRIVLPMLRSENTALKEAIVTGLSCTNINTYKTLLECLQPIFAEAFQAIQQSRSSQSKGFSGVYDSVLRGLTCVTQILKQISHFLEFKAIRQDVWIRTEIVSALQQLRDVVSSMHAMQGIPLKTSFCELLADTYTALKPSLMFSGRNPAEQWKLFWNTIERWSPYGTGAAIVLEDRAALNRRAPNDVVLAQFEIMKRDLDRATSRALAALLIDSQNFLEDLIPAQHWIHALLASNAESVSQETGREALENLLVSHASNPELLQDVVSKCYHNSSERSRGVAKIYFVALVNMLESHPGLTKEKVEKPQQFLALALFKIGDPDCETRFRAVKLIELVETGLYGSSVIGGEYQFRLRSTSPSVYKREIFVLSGKLAAERSQESLYLFSQMTRAFQAVNDSDRRDILSVLLPWIQHIEFNDDDDLGLQMVLANLLGITTVFSGRMQHEVEALWVALCTSTTGISNNALRILDFLLKLCLQHRTPGTVAVSRTVLIYLLSSPASSAITEKLLSYLEPSCMITQGSKYVADLVSPACKRSFPYVATLNDIVSLANENESKLKFSLLPPFSYGQLAVVFLVDTISASTPILPNLAALVHVCVVLGDHFVALVQDKSRELLLNVAGMINPEPKSMKQLTEQLISLRWRYEDDNGSVPDQLSELVMCILAHMNTEGSLDFREWAQIALRWATTIPVRHIACRSLQIYRCLGLHFDLKMLGDILARLSSTISEQSADVQGFATQTLMTLNATIDKMDTDGLIKCAPLFWASAASLSTANEKEYMESLSAMSKIFSKWSIDFSVKAVSCFPSRWECSLDEFPGVLRYVLRGLRSKNSAELSHQVINQLIFLNENASEHDSVLAFGKCNPLPELLAASIPWLLQAMEQPHMINALIQPIQALERMVAPSSSGLSRILKSFIKRRLWSSSDFLRQYIISLVTAFPDDTVNVTILTMSMVSNSTSFIRKSALETLKILVPEVDLRQATMRWRGADLIAPLLRLLTTTDVEESLSVLDIVGSVKPDKMDKDVLRMTLGARQLFHEYENTETLFGIPDECGWSVPKPAEASLKSKANVHAVFYTCVSEQTIDTDRPFDLLTQESALQVFQIDDYAPAALLSRQNSTSASAFQSGNESMSKILTDLDEFDSFFTSVAAPSYSHYKGLDQGEGLQSKSSTSQTDSGQVLYETLQSNPSSTRQSSPSPRNRSTSESESIPQLYDKKVSLILNRSLARTPSQLSFRTSFADSFGRSVPPAGISGPSVIADRQVSHSKGQLHKRQQSGTYSRYAHAMGDHNSVSLVRTRSQASSESAVPDAHTPDDASSQTIGYESHFDDQNPAYHQAERLSRLSLSDSPLSWRGQESSLQKLDDYDFFDNSKAITPKSSTKKKSRKSPKSPQDNSFRLESLLRGKRKGKAEKGSESHPAVLQNTPKSHGELFQFPPR